MTARRNRLVLATLVGAILATAAVVALRPAPQGPTGPGANDARNACDRARDFRELVVEDAAEERVRRVLGEAIVAASRAAAADTVWLPLQSGLETLEVALEHDDAGSANVGMRVVRANCAPFGGID